MIIRIGFNIVCECPQPTPMVLMLNVHPTRAGDVIAGDKVICDTVEPLRTYRDSFGNICTRVVAPPRARFVNKAIIRDTGLPDRVAVDAAETPVIELPDDALLYLMGSRYCETDELSETAWKLFGATQPGWARVQAICDFVHRHIRFGYENARSTRTAVDAFREGKGVCRDFAHLAIALCRAMNIPARYCTGYLGDIGVPMAPFPMDFSAWFEAYLDGTWYAFDARHNTPRIGRVLMARGRDAADVPLINSFGAHTLTQFDVWTEEATAQDDGRIDGAQRVA
ncbi:transglutaminase-like domain-containing protein [Limobrevibacterium gyesilva]|uniref:Transglutaminase family protein n=1 Tax=Limobrevibacterium gyesilva TaxID=2991712 RepID=A0AA42CFG5_9PROT|nr:transglutaminase family protein [Limobrevibacterium gyesilva]MCW3477153.1 transglutaminase family protein [Limobrevibacterium gyesilva]